MIMLMLSTTVATTRRGLSACSIFVLASIARAMGTHSPQLVYGTAWKEDATEEHTLHALRHGFVAIDTANQPKHYNEAMAARAHRIAEEWYRKPMWIQTKFTHVSGHSTIPYSVEDGVTTHDQVMESFQQSLDRHGHIDSFLLHAPEHGGGSGIVTEKDMEAYRAIVRLFDQGNITAFGVSNVDVDQLKQFHRAKNPMIVQNRCTSKSQWDMSVREYCAKRGISYQAFGLLTWSRHVLQSAPVKEAAASRGWTAAQVILAFALQSNFTVLTGPKNEQHMKDDVFVWKRGIIETPLSHQEMERIEFVDANNNDDDGSPENEHVHASFFNHFSFNVHLFWSGPSGLVHQGIIKPGTVIRVQTFPGHSFVASQHENASGEKLSQWTAPHRREDHDGSKTTIVHLRPKPRDEL